MRPFIIHGLKNQVLYLPLTQRTFKNISLELKYFIENDKENRHFRLPTVVNDVYRQETKKVMITQNSGIRVLPDSVQLTPDYNNPIFVGYHNSLNTIPGLVCNVLFKSQIKAIEQRSGFYIYYPPRYGVENTPRFPTLIPLANELGY